MNTLVLDISISLDGYITAAGQTPEEPLGPGGERLHEWAFGSDERNRAFTEDSVGRLGALITGRKNYEDSIRWWGADGPTGPATSTSTWKPSRWSRPTPPRTSATA